MSQRIEHIKEIIHSRKGKNTITFLVFLVISSVLWIVQSLNDEAQRDIRLAVKLTNVPDSVVRISPVPNFINVNVRSRGTTLLRYIFNTSPEMNIDYRNYISGNKIDINDASLKTYFRNKLGSSTQIISVNPDSIVILFTSSRGVEIPVKVDAQVEPGPQYAIIGKVRSLTDSVKLYSLDNAAEKIASISTQPIVLNNVSSSQTLRVPLITPPNTRAIPDSVDVRVEVESLVSKKREIEIRTINVPDDVNLVLLPRQIDVYYMVPMSVYKSSEADPKIVIQADYNSIALNPTNKIPVALVSAPQDFFDVYLTTDSVGYIIERK